VVVVVVAVVAVAMWLHATCNIEKFKFNARQRVIVSRQDSFHLLHKSSSGRNVIVIAVIF